MSIAASAVPSSLSIPGLRKPAFGTSAGKSRPAAPVRQEPASQRPARKWPFPPAPKAAGIQPAALPFSAVPSTASLDDVRKLSSSQIVSRKDMLIDVLMVAAWGLAIPAFMWLGAAAGF